MPANEKELNDYRLVYARKYLAYARKSTDPRVKIGRIASAMNWLISASYLLQRMEDGDE